MSSPSPTPAPLSFSDDQLSILLSYAQPLHPDDRPRFLERLAIELHGVDTPEKLRSTIARVQNEFLSRIVGRPKRPRRNGKLALNAAMSPTERINALFAVLE
jgi:hypothetical protein